MAQNGHRNYKTNYPSVTTVLGILRKIGLEMWFKFNTLEFCNNESARGKEIGTLIHEGIEQFIETGKIKVEAPEAFRDEVSNAIQGFANFKKDHPEIVLKRAEIQLTSEVYKYNGTMDCIGSIGDMPVIFDWKTGKCKKKSRPDIYDEYRYQVAAYLFAYNETHKKQIKRAVILSLAKDVVAYNYEDLKYQDLEAMFKEVFLPALKIYNYQKRK